ncbi:MAG: DNA-packaging protein, partial [Actinobacteria bacterium]|nr:DNA-packaging protein [Actinomycetota bacterium]
MNVSPAESLALLPASERANLLRDLTEAEAAELEFDWRFWARPDQVEPPGVWSIWYVQTGRGWGKTRTAAEWVRAHAADTARFSLVGRTAGDVRDVMVEGVSGILACFPPAERPNYEPSKRRITFRSGAVATLFASEEPDQLRGPQCERFWAEEIATWKYPIETWDNLMLGWRLGDRPRGLITSTPRPVALVRRLLKDPNVYVTRGSSHANRANLSEAYYRTVIAPYEGTRLGRQEVHGELLDDVPGALWTRALIERARIAATPRQLVRVAVAIDPAASHGESAHETGIVAGAVDAAGHGYLLDDLSLRGTPDEWASAALAAYHRLKADVIVAEANNGGDMVEDVIRTRDRNANVRKVHASRGKLARAEPVSALYEQGRIHHVGAHFETLEDDLCA